MKTTNCFRLLSQLTLAASAALGQTTPAPAPTTDRVGFPANYDTQMQVLYAFDRPDALQVRTIYGNGAAASVNPATMTFPYGSVLVMETWRALRDTAGTLMLTEDGRYRKDPAAAPTLFVMRKERGFGEAYGANRNGEWEYVAYRPDGTYNTRPEATAGCAACHMQAGALTDWTFRVRPLFLQGGSGATTDAVIKDYRFIPGELRVKAGSVVTFYNDDLVEHTVTDVTPNQGDSGPLRAGKTLSIKFSEKGEFNFRCTIHANMRGKIVVE